MKTITTLILISLTLCCINSASAQWVRQYGDLITAYGNDAHFLNSNTGWVCTGNGYVVKTTNGGTNWTAIPVQPDRNFLAIHFFDSNTGFVIGTKNFKTTNGGSNWTQFSFPVILSLYNSLSFIDNSTGWVCGNSGHVFKTTDAGNSWVQQNSGTSIQLNSIFFLNNLTGWAAGDNGGLVKTTDGGNNWQILSTGSSISLYDIRFTDVNNGKISANNSSYFTTTNGGLNWTQNNLTGTTFNRSLNLINSSTWWMMGGTGLYLTTNNGNSWIHQINNTRVYKTVLIEGIIYAFGDYFDKSTTGGFNLNAPPNLTLTPATTSSINLNWTDNSSDEDKFIIERSPDGTNGWTKIDSVGANVTSYTNTGLSYNTDYYYRVYAKKIIFTGGASNAPRMRAKLNAPSNIYPVNDTLTASPTPTLSWSSVSGGFTYNCQIATDAAFANIIYTSGNIAATSQGIPSGILQNSTKYYWRSKAFNLITYSDYSAASSFIVQDPNYGHNIASGNNFYYFANSTSGANLSPSKPTFNWRDTAGSISIILNGASQISLGAGNIDDGRFDLINILPAGNSIRFFRANYQSLYIGTNGIVAFSPFTPGGAGNYSPSTKLPQPNILNAIFPFWKDLDFSDNNVPVNRLCYKITSDELIITFMRAPNYNNTINLNDYVSFQVIISHSTSPAANSSIHIMYNYDQTGSSFTTKYNNNTLESNLIGLQASNSSSEILQYRYLNASQQLITPGPMFGSNLALAFGPDANALPVELSSFTSQVNGNCVKLNWATGSEINNSGFDIERKISGSYEWKKINFVQGNGTTNKNKNYSYEDKNITSGKYSYRLKQIDFNGNYEYFELTNEVEIGIPKKFNLSQNYPNPFNPSTKINYELPITNYVSIKVYDLTGKEIAQLVNENKQAGFYTVEFNAGNLASGMYFYRIQAGDFSAVKKMILVK
jgi:photosystem II stability/assembly factor-like uncharacterized protein